MKKIEVKVINEVNNRPGNMMSFLGRLTQRGHCIKNMHDLLELYNKPATKETKLAMAELPHGTIKRFSPITIAIVGASRRFLAQARTHQVGMNYVSASLQYSNYTSEADFVVPYSLIEADDDAWKTHGGQGLMPSELYLDACDSAMCAYAEIAALTDNDTAGYAAPQGLRNILIMQGNHQSWAYFIGLRGCNRNTVETQYVTLRIWEELLKTTDGRILFNNVGPACMFGSCPEGKMCCGSSLWGAKQLSATCDVSLPRLIIDKKWPLLNKEV